MDKSEGGTVVRGLEEVKAEKGASALQCPPRISRDGIRTATT